MKKGFTLIELMIVIVILGVLMAVALTNFKSVQIKSRDARRKNNLRQIASALEYYYNDQRMYPEGAANGNMKACGANAKEECAWGSNSIMMSNTTTNTIYMVKLPNDPSTGRNYYYVRSGTSSYKLYAMLENSEDRNPENTPSSPPDCGAGSCNYVITSSNTTP